jgi:hypothetical protein
VLLEHRAQSPRQGGRSNSFKSTFEEPRDMATQRYLLQRDHALHYIGK